MYVISVYMFLLTTKLILCFTIFLANVGTNGLHNAFYKILLWNINFLVILLSKILNYLNNLRLDVILCYMWFQEAE